MLAPHVVIRVIRVKRTQNSSRESWLAHMCAYSSLLLRPRRSTGPIRQANNKPQPRPRLINRTNLVIHQPRRQPNRSDLRFSNVRGNSRGLLRPCNPESPRLVQPPCDGPKPLRQFGPPIHKENNDVRRPARLRRNPHVARQRPQHIQKSARRTNQGHAMPGLDPQLLRKWRTRITRHASLFLRGNVHRHDGLLHVPFKFLLATR